MTAALPQVIWIRQATRQLIDVHAYIAQDNPAAADRLLLLIYQAADRLRAFPEIGRPGRITGTRELVIPGTAYVIAYRLRASSIRILALLHGAQRWPGSLSDPEA